MVHRYNKDEWVLPSVTEIEADCTPKEWYGPWAANMTAEWIRQHCKHKDEKRSIETRDYLVSENQLDEARKNFRNVSQEALDVGSTTHHAIEHWLKTNEEPDTDNDQVISAFLAFLEFYDEHKMEPIWLEKKVYGNYWGGTLDFFGRFNGRLYVIDFKTAKAHYPHNHGPQVAAYRSCVLEAQGCGVLRLDKESGLPDWKDYSKQYERYLREFNLMVPLFMARHPRIAKAAGWKEE